MFSFLYSADEHFVVYLFSGLIMLHFFIRSTSHAMNSLSTKKGLLISLNIPKIIFPISSVLTGIWTFFIEIFLLGIFVIIFGLNLTETILLLFPIYLLLGVLVLGFSLILAVLRTYLKDFQSVWGIITMSLLFITPIFWYVKDMPEEVSQILLFNPLALLIEMAHKVLIFGTFPSIFEWAYVITTTIGILFVGYYLFRKTERRLVELL